MKHIFAIVVKDIREIVLDKMTFIFLLAMPVLFTVLFGFAFGGLGKKQVDNRIPVGYQDLDKSTVSQGLRDFLENQPAIRLEEQYATTSELERLVSDHKLAAIVIVPEGYGESLGTGKPLKLQGFLDLGSIDGMTAQNAIQAAASRTASASAAAQIMADGRADLFSSVFEAASAAWITPPVRLELREDLGSAGEGGSQGESAIPITHTAPAMMIQFSLVGLVTAAQMMVHERKTRCMQRLLTTRAARHEILLGHFLAIFVLIFIQFILLVVFGQLVLRLDYLSFPWATLLMMLTTALFVAAVGLFVGSLARNDDQAVIFALAPMFVLSGLGGAWLPLETTGQAFRSIGQVTPVALALDGFSSILSSSMDTNTILLPAVALSGYALVCFGLAVWKFKFE